MSEKGTDEHIQHVLPHGVQYVRAPSRIANPGPAGIFSFASTTFILSMFNVNVRGIEHPHVVVGMAIFAGGLVQFMAGMWEFPRGNVYAASVFSSFGAFWMSYATIFLPASGILAAYPTGSTELSSALGIYLCTWLMVTILFIVPCLRRSLLFTILLTCLALAFAMLASAEFSGKHIFQKLGGVFGIITALIAYYIGLSELLEAEEKPIVRLPRGICGL